MSISRTISAYRWPIILGGFLGMSILANGILVYVATRPSTAPPIKDYYEKSLEWDANAADLAASQRLGWKVEVEIPSGAEFEMTAVRPVDLKIQDANGQPVSGLTGRVVAVRPSDARLNGESALAELTHAPGSYRTLARLPVPGVWELSLDAYQGETHFVHTKRIEVAGSEGR